IVLPAGLLIYRFASRAGATRQIVQAPPYQLTAPLPQFPEPGPRRQVAPGVEMARVTLSVPGPGQRGTLYVYTPPGPHRRHSLPCVLIAPAGAPVILGMQLGEGDQPEHLPYVQQGFAVVAYEIDGSVPDLDNASDSQLRYAFAQYRAASAGLINARNALEFVLARLPEVDPNRLYTAGHSSAGRQALLWAAHEPRLKGCISYCGVSNVPESAREYYWSLKAISPAVDDFLVQSSPSNHVARLQCPVLLFHAEDDSNVPVEQSREFAEQLRQAGKQVILQTVPTGDHYDSMIHQGIPAGIAWLRQIDQQLASQSPSATGEEPADQRPSAAGNELAGRAPGNAGGQLADRGPSARGEPPQFTPPQFTPPQFTPPQFTPPPVPQPPQFTPPGSQSPQFTPPGSQPPQFTPPPVPRPPQFTPPNPRGMAPRQFPGGQPPGVPGGPPNVARGFPGDEPPDVDALLVDLRSNEVPRMIVAAGRLAHLDELNDDKRQEVADVLVDLLDHEQINVTISASLAAAKWATPRQIDGLVAALDSANPLVRVQILQALGGMRDERAAGALAQRLAVPQDRGGASLALSKMGELAEEHVLRMARHDDPSTRREAVQLLRRIGTGRSLPVVQELADSDPDPSVQSTARSALRMIEQRK
ncbi:MAG: HEAT repeat domain-containing protein, partial [Pirellulaceae bacterium]|nr:HEAT repeat domain-containing protein [Pirellulaceae bacterium]